MVDTRVYSIDYLNKNIVNVCIFDYIYAVRKGFEYRRYDISRITKDIAITSNMFQNVTINSAACYYRQDFSIPVGFASEVHKTTMQWDSYDAIFQLEFPIDYYDEYALGFDDNKCLIFQEKSEGVTRILSSYQTDHYYKIDRCPYWYIDCEYVEKTMNGKTAYSILSPSMYDAEVSTDNRCVHYHLNKLSMYQRDSGDVFICIAL